MSRITVPALSITNLTVLYDTKPILQSLTCEIPMGVLCAIVGPNGAGKSTLLKTIVGLIKPFAGTICIANTHKKNISHTVAYIPQRSTVDWDFPISVYDVVMMGRYAYIGWFRRPRAADHHYVREALRTVALEEYAATPIGALSGGQQQRVFLARALVQEASLFLFDEPFVGIDAPTEQILVALFKKMRSEGRTIIMVHHDVNALNHYFDWLVLLNKTIIGAGPIAVTLNHGNMTKAYGKQVYEIGAQE
jgi:manganese/zinc/iron transport system ATP- binding protein